MNRVVHFEFAVEDPDRTAKFYTEVFGWKISNWAGPVNYWLISTGPEKDAGIDGGFMLRSERDENMGKGTINTIEVPSVEEYIEKIEKSGGKAISPKMPIPGTGYLAYCKDTEGNTFGIMSNDPDVK
ncbi:MAG: VOC family protein [Actinobacteria bacterium]|nr:VOC family protein [Actinomycetota bacterium]